MRFLLGYLLFGIIFLSLPALALDVKVSTHAPNLVSPDLSTISEYNSPLLIAQASQEEGDATSSEMESDDSDEADIVIGGPEPSEEPAPAEDAAEEEKPSEEVTAEPVPQAEPVPSEAPAVVEEVVEDEKPVKEVTVEPAPATEPVPAEEAPAVVEGVGKDEKPAEEVTSEPAPAAEPVPAEPPAVVEEVAEEEITGEPAPAAEPIPAEAPPVVEEVAEEEKPAEAVTGDADAADEKALEDVAEELEAPEEEPDSDQGEDSPEEAFAILVKSIEITGNSVIETPVLQEKVDAFKGRELTLEEMGELADLVTITYQEQGYILARAYLPEQEIDEGQLTIAVQEGKIGKVIVSGGRHFDERVIKRYFKPQEKRGAINESLLEKGLLLSSAMPKIKTDIVLKEGEKPGEVDLVINTQDTSELTFGVDASIDYNNFGSDLVSADRYGLSLNIIDHYWGSRLALRGVTGNTYEDSTLGTLKWTIPVSSHGTQIQFSYLLGNYVVGQQFAELGFAGDTENKGFKVTHPLIKKKNMNLEFEAGYEVKYSEQEQLGVLEHIDDLESFYIGLNFDNLDRYLGKNIASLQYLYGRVNRDPTFTPSRTNLDDTYHRIFMNVARIQKVYGYTNALLRASGQYSSNRLPSAEQIILGGYGSVRGHAPSVFLGDYGYGVSAELMFAPPFIADKTVMGQRLAQMFQLVLFYDHGGVYTNDVQAGESTSEGLSGFGTGFRFFYKDRFTFKYDIGIPVDQIEGEPDLYNYVSGSMKFF